MMKSAVFLQVRLDSSRLPGKALKTIAGRTVIEHAMASLKNIPADDFVLVTADGDESRLAPYAERMGFDLYAGSRNDVLDRFIQAGRLYKPDIIIRATGDNPLVAWEPATEVLERLKKQPATDYMAMKGLPLGCGVEVFRRAALEQAYSRTEDAYDHEHVTPYLYRNPDRFRLEYLHTPADMEKDYRVTLDTRDDYYSIKRIFDHIYRGTPVPFDELTGYLKRNDQI